MRKIFSALFLLLLLASACFADAVPGDVIVVLRNTSGQRLMSAGKTEGALKSLSSVKAFTESVNANVKRTYDALSAESGYIFMVIHSDNEDEKSLLEKVRKNPNVIAASLNNKVHALRAESDEVRPNDSEYYKLWGMEAIKAPRVWKKGTGSDDVYIAVLDSGVDYNHPDIAPNFSHEYSRNFVAVDGKVDPKAYFDENKHGTHCAGTIAAVGNNSIGVAGVNWKAKIISVRVLNAVGGGTDDDVMAGINYVTELLTSNPNLNIAAVNFSVGGSESTVPNANLPYYLALKALSDTNRTIFCAAAGNDFSEVGVPNFGSKIEVTQGEYVYPPSVHAVSQGIDNMIVIAAVTPGLERADFSNYDRRYVDVAAPGVAILSTVPYNASEDLRFDVVDRTYAYQFFNGTSMATPHVAGAVALLKSLYPKATTKQIKAAIIGGADGSLLRDDGTSMYGFLNLEGAVNFLERTLASADTKPMIAPASLSEPTVGQTYRFQFYASGSEPLTWSIQGGLPEGLSFDNGIITGTPKSSGKTSFIVFAENDYGYDTLVTEISVDEVVAPVISMDNEFYCVVEDDSTLTVKLSEGTWPFVWEITKSSDVNDGSNLTINNTTGIVNFIPANARQYKFTVKVSNSAGQDEKEFTYTADKKLAAAISRDTALAVAAVGQIYTAGTSADYAVRDEMTIGKGEMIEAEGTFPLYWSVEGLPDGMKYVIDSENAAIIWIGGRPLSPDTYHVIVTVSNDIGTGGSSDVRVDSKDFELKVITEPVSFVESSYDILFNAGIYDRKAIAVLGSLPISYNGFEGKIPDGMSVDCYMNSIVITGCPTKSGDCEAIFYVSNDLGQASVDVRFYVLSPTIITTYVLDDAVKGYPYSFTLKSAMNVPLTWTESGDVLSKAGLALSASGTISGTPSEAGVFKFTVRAKGANGDADIATRSYILTVHDRPAITTASALPGGTQNKEYPVTEIKFTGSAPTTFSVNGGSMPAGLILSSNGYIHGTPIQSGTFTFTVGALNPAGTSSKDFTVVIASDGSTPSPTPSSDDKKSTDSDDTKPTPTPTPTPTPSSDDKSPTIGKPRGISSLTTGELSELGTETIAAILPEITVRESKTYTAQEISAFANILLSSDVQPGATLVWHPFVRTSASASASEVEDSASQATFYNKNGSEVETVPADRTISVSAYLEAGKTYAPVISTKSTVGVSSSSGGCSAGALGFAIFLPLCAVIFRKNSR